MSGNDIRKEIELLKSNIDSVYTISSTMKHFTTNFKGKADNKIVSQIVSTYFK